MRLFGHHVGRSFAIFVAIDGALSLVLVSLLSWSGPFDAPLTLKFQHAAGLITAFLLIPLSIGVYNRDAAQDFRTFVRRFALAGQLVLLLAVGFLMFSQSPAGLAFGWRLTSVLLALGCLLLLLFGLRVILLWGAGRSLLKKRLILIGDGRIAEEVAAFVTGPAQAQFQLVETVDRWRVSQAMAATVGNLSLSHNPPEPLDIAALAESIHAHEIVVAVEDRRGLPVEQLLECRLKGISVVDALTFWERETGQINPAHAGAAWLTFSEGFALDQRHRMMKRAADIAIAVAFLVFILPLALVLSLAIRLESPGPIFYRQERVGLNGRIFKVWKFRSMRVDAERDGVPRWANTGDDRVTRIGRFIRKVRLDEAPQVLNVLAGHMSFIGPRPERPFFVEQLKKQIPHYDLRHRVRPGITGWAQVNYSYGASVEDAERKLAYDLYYLKRNDLLLDLAILAQTVRVVLFSDGAR